MSYVPNMQQAREILARYNQEEFHLRHAVTVEHVMRWFARELGYGDREEFWGIVGLLHDLDFERWPEEHCKKSQELMRQAGVEEEIVRLRAIWHTPALAELPAPKQGAPLLSRLFTASQLDQMDLFDKIQLENVIRVCCDCSTRTEAGRKLFGVSRGRKKHADDTTRLNKYLKSQGVTWEQIQSLRYR